MPTGITFEGPLAPEGASTTLPDTGTAAAAPTHSPVAAAALASFGSMACYIDLAGERYPAKLPLMPSRMLIVVESSEVDDEDWLSQSCVHAAVVGMCWRGPRLAVGDLRREYKNDLVDYGEAVLDALVTAYGVRMVDVTKEGARLISEIVPTMISQLDIDEAREDFTDGPPENSDEVPELAPPSEGWPVGESATSTT